MDQGIEANVGVSSWMSQQSTRGIVRGVAAVVCACGLVVGAAACSSKDDSAKSSSDAVLRETFQFASPGGKLEITYPEDQRAPVQNFSGPSLRDVNKTVSLSDFDGKVVVISAWGQWCGPCRTEVDDLQEIQEKISPRGGTVLGVNVRDSNPQIALDFLRDNGATYPSLWDPPFKTAAALGGVPASVIPTTIVLDRQHRPAAVFLREITADEVLKVVEPLLAEGSSVSSSTPGQGSGS